ncbi:MAG: LamG domain-containing protein [bacterium]
MPSKNRKILFLVLSFLLLSGCKIKSCSTPISPPSSTQNLPTPTPTIITAPSPSPTKEIIDFTCNNNLIASWRSNPTIYKNFSLNNVILYPENLGLFFNGKDSYAIANNTELSNLLNNLNTFTIEGLITIESTSDNWQTILSKYEWTNNPNRSYELILDSNNHLVFAYSPDGTDSNEQMLTSKNEIPLHNKTHIAAIYDGKKLSLFINKQVEGIKPYKPFNSSSPFFQHPYPVTLGANNQGEGQFFHGFIQELRVYSEYRETFCLTK